MLAVDLLGDLGGFALGLEVVGLELGLHAVVLGAVVGGGAQRLAALQQEIAGKSVLDADDFAHLAELGDAFQQNDFHIRSPFEVMSVEWFELKWTFRMTAEAAACLQKALTKSEHGVGNAENDHRQNGPDEHDHDGVGEAEPERAALQRQRQRVQHRKAGERIGHHQGRRRRLRQDRKHSAGKTEGDRDTQCRRASSVAAPRSSGPARGGSAGPTSRRFSRRARD